MALQPAEHSTNVYELEPITLTTGDLNNIKTFGKYYWSSGSSQNINHVPVTAQSIMEVFNMGSGRVAQRVYTTVGSSFYIRRFDGTSWGSWYKYTGEAQS